jgi:two-component system, OmpR family, sensor histidine kinase CiaH
MFHKTIVKLTALYLGIIMLISLLFSVALYQLSVAEFNRGSRGQREFVQQLQEFRNMPLIREQLINYREAEIHEAKQRVLSRLLLENVLILLGGGILSYFLAKRTLAPIEQSHQALEQFTADASHELRTPLAAMQTEIEVALMDPKLSLAEAKQQLNSNLEELSRLTHLSESLLRLARGTQALSLRTFAAKDFIAEAVDRVAALAATKHIAITKQVAKNVGSLHGDREALHELLVVLLDNAIKYSPEKSKIVVQVERSKSAIRLMVKDQGIGVRPEEVPQLFERFYRADAARTHAEQSGYGLGLAIAKQIADAHSARITVTPNKPKGSVFALDLPSSSHKS